MTVQRTVTQVPDTWSGVHLSILPGFCTSREHLIECQIQPELFVQRTSAILDLPKWLLQRAAGAQSFPAAHLPSVL